MSEELSSDWFRFADNVWIRKDLLVNDGELTNDENKQLDETSQISKKTNEDDQIEEDNYWNYKAQNDQITDQLSESEQSIANQELLLNKINNLNIEDDEQINDEEIN